MCLWCRAKVIVVCLYLYGKPLVWGIVDQVYWVHNASWSVYNTCQRFAPNKDLLCSILNNMCVAQGKNR